MKKKTRKQKTNKGVTLIALIITIIVLLILVGVTILTLTGENGILGKSGKAKEETNEKAATEIMNLKITNAQIQSYKETEQMPNLQYLANRLCDDTDMEYVDLISRTKKQASTDKKHLDYIDVPEKDSIFTKLNDYPYEFEIDSDLKLASIDGVKIANNEENVTIPKEEYDKLKSMGEMELIGEGSIASTTDTITLSKSIENYRFIYFKAHLNSKDNDSWMDDKIIPATLNSNVVLVLINAYVTRVNTVCIKDTTTISVKTDQTTDKTWASTYVFVYGIK